MTEPAVQLLHERGYKVDVLCETVGSWVFKNNQCVNELHLWDKKKQKPKSIFELVKKLRSKKYDLVFDFQTLPKTLALSLFLNATKRVSMTRGIRRYFYHDNTVPDGTYPGLQKVKAVAKELGLSQGDYQELALARLFLTEAEKEKANSFFAKVKGKSSRKKILVVCPVSRQPYKVVDPKSMAKLCSALLEQGYYLLPIYGPGQQSQVEQVNAHLGEEAKIDLIPNSLSLREWFGVLQQCSCYLGVDGGHKHLAVSAQIPTFTLYHHVPPFWHPHGLKSHAFLDMTPKNSTKPTEEQMIQEVSAFVRVSLKS